MIAALLPNWLNGVAKLTPGLGGEVAHREIGLALAEQPFGRIEHALAKRFAPDAGGRGSGLAVCHGSIYIMI